MLLISCLLVGAGVAFLAVSTTAPISATIPCAESLPIFEKLRAETENSRRKLTLMGPYSILPTVGCVCGLTYLVIFLACAPIILVKYRRRYGLRARLMRPGIITAAKDQRRTGLLVYVDRNGNLYLNSRRMTEEELGRALEEECARRADWSVYVEGEPTSSFSAVIRAMDLVRSAHGKVIMLTPKMREEEEAGRRRGEGKPAHP